MTVRIDEQLVRRLVASQFPAWASLPVRQVLPGGNDNRTFRLGDDLAVRLSSAEGYVAGVAKEQRWLPALAPQLPLPIPAPVAAGAPGEGYDWPWSINRWLEGETLNAVEVHDRTQFARDLAAFLRALHSADATGGPLAGEHSFYRGAPPLYYDDETRAAIAEMSNDTFDPDAALAVWQAAIDRRFTGPPVWFHGDIAHGNLLVQDDRLAAVIDFGTSGVGDPACDLVIAWTYFSPAERQVFRDAVGLDEGAWARARGWSLWKALITLAQERTGETAEANRSIIAALLDDPVAQTGHPAGRTGTAPPRAGS